MSATNLHIQSPAAPRRRALLLDLDGTLADTLPALCAAMNVALRVHGLEPTTQAVMRPAVSGGTAGMVALAAPSLDPTLAEPVGNTFLDAYQRSPCTGVAPFAGFRELLREHVAAGGVYGIVTNKRSRFTRPVVEGLGLDPVPGCVISSDDVTRGKPSPESLLLACQQVGTTPAESVYVGDALGDVTAAHAAGMPCLLAGWGYLPTDGSALQWPGDDWLDEVSALTDWLQAR